MRIAALMAAALSALTASVASANMITCPTQTQPNRVEIMPPSPMTCEQADCNVVSRPVGGKNFCLWSCAAHLEMFLNGIPMQQFLDAYKAYKEQKQ
jgi:hypothetical protein